MAKFLTTRKAVSEIEDLIKNAGEKLFLISPYLKLSKDFKELLMYRNNNDKISTIVFGKQELKPDEISFLQSLRFISLRYNEDLHAKCYLNDSKMIITSLNLYEFSMANNKEMGVLIDKNDPNDSPVFEEALKEVEYIIQTSQRFELGNVKKQFNTAKEAPKRNSYTTGYCIRSGCEIPFNPERPLSYEAFQIWNQYGDPDYPERYCHFSGEPSNGETSVRYPIMRKNWDRAVKTHGIITSS